MSTNASERFLDLMAPAVAAVTPESKPVACSHVFDGTAEVLSVCVLHPATGVLCKPCGRQHQQQHEVDTTCATCGRADVGVIAADHWLEWAEPIAVVNADGDATTVAVRGAIHFVGLRVCARCRDEMIRDGDRGDAA